MIIIIIIIIHRILTNNYSKIDWKQKSISDIKEKHNIIMSTFRGLDGKYFHLLDDWNETVELVGRLFLVTPRLQIEVLLIWKVHAEGARQKAVVTNS